MTESDPYDHLDEETKKTLEWDKPDRIAWNEKEWWISYPAAEEGIRQIEKLMKRPRNIRPRNKLLIAAVGGGKSSLVQQFASTFPETTSEVTGTAEEYTNFLIASDLGGGRSSLLTHLAELHQDIYTWEVVEKPVVYVKTPPAATEGRIYSQILKKLGAEKWDKGTIDTKLRMVINGLQLCKTKLLIIDDVHRMLEGGVATYGALKAIRYIMDELQIPMVFAGKETAQVVIDYEDQLTTTLTTYRLPRWKDGVEFRDFLYSYERKISLKKASKLWHGSTPALILELSGKLDKDPDKRQGIMANVVHLIQDASELALLDGAERITERHLKAAAEDPGNDAEEDS